MSRADPAGTEREGPWTIGIAGPSCSGKTSLAHALAAALGGSAAVVSLDAWYRDLSSLPAALRGAVNFDHPEALDVELMEQQLPALARGAAVEIPVYDFATHSRSGWRLVDPGPALIVEGLLTFHWAFLREICDLRVYVDLDEAACLARRIGRDVAIRGRTRESVERQYARTVAPMQRRFVLPGRRHADIVIDGGLPPAEGAGRVLRAPQVPRRFSATLLE